MQHIKRDKRDGDFVAVCLFSFRHRWKHPENNRENKNFLYFFTIVKLECPNQFDCCWYFDVKLYESDYPVYLEIYYIGMSDKN